MIRLKECDGARDVYLSTDSRYAFIETGRACYRFDRAIFAKAVAQALAMSSSP